MTDETMSRTHVEEGEPQTPELQQSEQLEPSQQQNPDQADKQEPQQEDELADERPDEVITQQQQSESNCNDHIPVGHLDGSDDAMTLEADETVENPIEAQTQTLEGTEGQSTDGQEMDVVDQHTDIVDQATDSDYVMDDDSNKEADVVDPEEQERVQQQCQRELEKLRAIDAKVRQVHERLSSRLPRQRTHLVTKVCGSVWAAKAQTRYHNNAGSLAKKLRLELGAFDYQVREQGELLTRHLCELDDVLSFGDTEIKDARKALVVFIQSEELPLADALRIQSNKLRAFGERLVASVATAASSEASSEDTPVSSTEASSSVEQSSNQNNDNGDNDDNDDNDDEMVDSDANNEDQDGDGNDGNDADRNDVMDDSAAEDQSDEARATTDPRTLVSLPVWKPYYQIQQRRDALYLIANLRDVEPQNVRVQWLERTGVLHISGVKLPTRRDVMVLRFSGVPTFGRFEIVERVPASVGVDMARASQTLDEDGTLEVRMPYAAPRVGDILDGMRFVRPRDDISNNHSNEYPNYYANVAGRPYSQQPYEQRQPTFHQSNKPYQPRRQSYYNYQHPYQQELHQSLYPLQRDYYQQQQQHQGFPHSAFRRRGSPWFDAPRCMVW